MKTFTFKSQTGRTITSFTVDAISPTIATQIAKLIVQDRTGKADANVQITDTVDWN